MDRKLLFASKKLNKRCLRIENDIFSADVLWCRSAYDGSERWNYSFHRHSFIELQFVLTGCITYGFSDSGKDIAVNSGEFLFVPVDVAHCHRSIEKNSSVFKLAFNITEPKSLNNDIKKFIGEQYVGKSDPYILKSVEFLHYLACLDSPGYRVTLKSQLSAFGAYVIQKVMRDYEFAQSAEEIDDNDDRVHIIKQIIKDNLSEKLRVDDIARQLNVSKRQLNRIVKASEDLSVSELIVKIRISKAKKLLAGTRISVERIAEMTGFLNGSYLARVFKSLEGSTPSQYRKDIFNTYRKEY